MISETKYKAWGETRYSSGTNPTDYTYTGQYSYTDDFGLMFYNARWYDPSLGRFAQADTIVPGGSQGLDRYSYTFNNPIRYTDPSGHVPADCYGADNYCGASNSNLLSSGKRVVSGVGRASGGMSNNPAPTSTPNPFSQDGYMGGASPASVYQWQDFGSNSSSDASYPPIEVFADILNIVAMNSPTAAATLQALLKYTTSESGDVVNIEITIVNEGESSAILQKINMSEESLPNFQSCTITTDCYFEPVSQVSIDPGEVEFITICQNCLEDRTTIYSHPFYPNKNNYIEVFMVLSMPTYTGSNGVENKNHPFIYTIPPR